jgi:hypothetical protein
MANGSSRGERLQIMLSGEELTVLDDFRFKKRMSSRAAESMNFSNAASPPKGSRLQPSAPSLRSLARPARCLVAAKKVTGTPSFRLSTGPQEPSTALFIYQGRSSFASVVESEQKSVCAMPYRVNADLPPHF